MCCFCFKKLLSSRILDVITFYRFISLKFKLTLTFQIQSKFIINPTDVEINIEGSQALFHALPKVWKCRIVLGRGKLRGYLPSDAGGWDSKRQQNRCEKLKGINKSF